MDWRKISESIDGINDYYYVSENGDIKSTKASIKLLKQSDTKYGYKQVCLSTKNRKYKKFYVHRLVALAFISNPQSKPQVNHINEVKTDNYIGNLEWVTSKENNNHGTRTARDIQTKLKTKEYYWENAIRRSNFREACLRKGWDFKDFEELFAGWLTQPNGNRERIYRYHQKNENKS